MKVIKTCSLAALMSLPLLGCNGSSNDNDSPTDNDSLTGIWQENQNNSIAKITQSGSTVEFDFCGDGEGSSFLLEDGFLVEGSEQIFAVLSSNSLELLVEVPGLRLSKLSESTQYNSGSVQIQSDVLDDVDVDADVCAYQEADTVNSHIGVPYREGSLEINVYIDNLDPGTYDLSNLNIDIDFVSAEIPGEIIFADSGEMTIYEISTERLKIDFTFTAMGGNVFSGAVDVDL